MPDGGSIWEFEHRRAALAPRRVFLLRVAAHAAAAAGGVAVALAVGILGYHLTEGMSWLDAYLNASMILSGMGPVSDLHTSVGKLFAGAYAIFSGVVFIALAGILLAPVAHRVLHRLHLDTGDGE